MVKGVVRIETRISLGDENGVYRINEQKQRYLMLAFDEADEARRIGRALAELLEVSYHDHIYSEPKLEGAISGQGTSVLPKELNLPCLLLKPKRVMGAEKLCVKLLTDDKLPEKEVEKILLDKYLQAGHKPVKANQLVSWVLRSAKKLIPI